mgnify:CR=1 FL=1
MLNTVIVDPPNQNLPIPQLPTEETQGIEIMQFLSLVDI